MIFKINLKSIRVDGREVSRLGSRGEIDASEGDGGGILAVMNPQKESSEVPGRT